MKCGMQMYSLNINPKYASIIEKYLTGKGDDDDSSKKKYFDAHSVDRFGVFHPEGIQAEEESVEEKQRFARRLGKWRDMTDNLNHEHSPWTKLFNDGHPSEKLVRRTFKGIPPQFRMIAWPMYLFVPRLKRENPRVYSRMLDLALATSDDLGQIDLDIMRTFRNTTYFCDRFGPRQQALFRILAAYSVYNREVGYCQGMSELVGMLLTYIIEDEDAFWAFSQLMEGPKHTLHCVFKAGFPGLTRQLSHHEVIVKKLLPSLSKHFTKLQLDTSCYALKWFMQCFMDRLPLSLVLRLWDVYLLEGECILFAMAYNILKLHKKRLLQMDEHQVLSFFQDELPKDFKYTDDWAIESLKVCLEQLHRNHLSHPAPPGKDMLPQIPLGQMPFGVSSSSGSSACLNLASSSSTSNRMSTTSVSVPFTERRQSSTSSLTTQGSGIHKPQGLVTSAAILTMSAMSKHPAVPSYINTARGEQPLYSGQSEVFSGIFEPHNNPNTTLPSQYYCSLGTSQYPLRYRVLPIRPRPSTSGRTVKVVPYGAVPSQPVRRGQTVNLDHDIAATDATRNQDHFISVNPSPKTVDALNPAERQTGHPNQQINRQGHSGGDQVSSRSSNIDHMVSSHSTKPKHRHVNTEAVRPFVAARGMNANSSDQSSSNFSSDNEVTNCYHNHRTNRTVRPPEDMQQKGVYGHHYHPVKKIPSGTTRQSPLPPASVVRLVLHRSPTHGSVETHSSNSDRR